MLFTDYSKCLDELSEKFGEEAVKYIAAIHPVNWTLFGNSVDMYDNNDYAEFVNNR
jgi:hypothetical protein